MEGWWTIRVVLLGASSAAGWDGSYVNPVIDSNHPDPGVLRLPDNSGYVAVSTSNLAVKGRDPAFPILFSADLIRWTPESHVFPKGGWPTWARADMWAPEIHRVNNRHHVYFAAMKEDDDLHAIGLAISTGGPFGPYIDVGEPIVNSNDTSSIDVTWFGDPVTGKSYLSWKDDTNVAIDIREVQEDGHTFASGSKVVKLVEPTLQSDFNCVEGPWILYRAPYHYLLFSADGFGSAHYHVAVARSEHGVEGPYERWHRNVLEVNPVYDEGRNSTFVGPGHGSVVQTPNDGHHWFVYHAWRYEKIFVYPPGRTMMLDKINWTEDGWPVIGNPSSVPTPSPSSATHQASHHNNGLDRGFLN